MLRVMAPVDAFVAKWAASGAAERANKDSFLRDLCDVLGVPHPDPTTGDPERDLYVFEKDAPFKLDDGTVSIRKIDLYKAGCFILEAKQGSDAGSKKVGTAKRGTQGWDNEMLNAYGQALGYAKSFDKPPPFLVVVDIGHCFELYASFDGSYVYSPFPNALNVRIQLKDLADEKKLATLRAVFTDPFSLDPTRRATKVTQDVAGHLAQLARALEKDKHPPDLVAKFLMRCLFTMFAEDVGLLPERLFTDAIEKHWLPDPKEFPGGIENLWRAMNDGTAFGFLSKLLRFNGGLFKNQTALPLDKKQLGLLLEAAKCDWSDVEPAIFGTLLERALDAKERHALGAHFTPRAYVERLVRPTLEEPLRAQWDIVQIEVRRLVEEANQQKTQKAADQKLKAAVARLKAFHRELAEVQVLDPACGSGNFLYVALDSLKRLENEVLARLVDLGESQMLELATVRVNPSQFHGIEIKPWAKEIAELVLWIGYLQWQARASKTGKLNQKFEEPVLRDYGNIECRDAVLAYDRKDEQRDEKGNAVTRWDGETKKFHPVTGEEVPDERFTTPVYHYVNPRKADWPKVDFIVGNPPFVGNKRMRQALGDGYVKALRTTYPDVPESADLVMYWWHIAAEKVRAGAVVRFGLITTNSLTQSLNRQVVQEHLEAASPLSLVFAVPDHPWVDSADGAAVRIAMTVAKAGQHPGIVQIVTSEDTSTNGTNVTLATQSGVVHADLGIGADVAAATSLRSNAALAFQGVIPLGDGFRLTRAELEVKGFDAANLPPVLRRFVIGRDIVQRREERWVIDFFGKSSEQARAEYPTLFQHLLTRVKPERDQNRRESRKKNWWLFGENAPKLRRAMAGLRRVIGTPDTSKFKPFVFFDADVLPDVQVYTVASDDAFVLGVLSSRAHQAWLQRVAPRMGMGNDLRWKPAIVFAPFPFPACEGALRDRVRATAERLDAHRKQQQASYPELTLTAVYNVLDKLRAGQPLTAQEQVTHEQGLVSVLQQAHDDLDEAVFDAYGWPRNLTDDQILERLVALNAARAEEEKKGIIQWLRPDLQNPVGAKRMTQVSLTPDEEGEGAEPARVTATALAAWPKKLPEQVSLVRDLVVGSSSSWTAEQAARAFKGAKPGDVASVLDSLAALGLVMALPSGSSRQWRGLSR